MFKISVKIVKDSVYFDRMDTLSVIIYRTTVKEAVLGGGKSREGYTKRMIRQKGEIY